jgi:hypothetical protein
MKRLLFAIRHACCEFMFVMCNYYSLIEEQERQQKEDFEDYWASRF